MRERPILFNGEMVRAILDGRKTQTRRPVKNLPRGWEFMTEKDGSITLGRITSSHPKKGRFGAFTRHNFYDDKYEHDLIPCQYGQPGDRLWVRETWAESKSIHDSTIFYKATDKDIKQRALDCSEREDRWRPSIHMFREYSRIDLEIKDIRVERLQDISEEDAKSEGINRVGNDTAWEDYCRQGIYLAKAVDSFASLWQSINGPDSWGQNPWVWVVEFEKL